MASFRFEMVACVGAGFVLSACESTLLPPPELPVLEIADKTCVSEVDLSEAVSLTPEKERKWYDLRTPVNAETPCIGEGEAAANYVVYALPEHGPNHVVTIGGQKQPIRILAPAVTTLNEDGSVSREFDAEEFMELGNAYAAQLRPRETERYILVKTNPTLVGETLEGMEVRRMSGTNYVSTSAGGATYTTYSGAESSASRTFSHEGVIGVRIQARGGKVGIPEE